MRACFLAIGGLCLSLSAAHAKSDCALMQKLAQEHANSMAARNMMDHAGFDGRAAQGAKAENTAYGVNTKAQAIAMWWASPPHAANMLLPGCKAVASAVSRSGVRYWAMEIAKTNVPRPRRVAAH